jgi:hypothetical protein
VYVLNVGSAFYAAVKIVFKVGTNIALLTVAAMKNTSFKVSLLKQLACHVLAVVSLFKNIRLIAFP